MSKVKFAIPKGSLEEATFKLLESSWTRVSRKSRTYRVFDFFYDFEDVYIKPLTRLGATPLECLQAIEKTLVDEIKLLKEVDPDWWGEAHSQF